MTPENGSGDDLVVFRGGFMYEADLVAQALEEAGVPHYQRVENFSGMQFARTMNAPGPGDFFLVLVPRRAADDAEEVIAGLPIERETNPGVWSFQPSRRHQRFWKWWVWFCLLAAVLAGIGGLVDTFMSVL